MGVVKIKICRSNACLSSPPRYFPKRHEEDGMVLGTLDSPFKALKNAHMAASKKAVITSVFFQKQKPGFVWLWALKKSTNRPMCLSSPPCRLFSKNTFTRSSWTVLSEIAEYSLNQNKKGIVSRPWLEGIYTSPYLLTFCFLTLLLRLEIILF